jgi:hypothetical protein
VTYPYIGVTGFTAPEEVSAALAALPVGHSHLIMVGVLASSKTLARKPNRYPRRYPSIDSISEIFPGDARCLNLIHYSTDDRATLAEQIESLCWLGAPNLGGFQLNIAWPKPGDLRALRGSKLRVVLQLGRMALVDCRPLGAALHLDDYWGLITDVLIDMSGGRGEPLDLTTTLAYARTIRDRHPWLGVGVAGGLSADSGETLRALAAEFPGLSIDAEGRLRTADDRLDVSAMSAYVSLAAGIFSEAK